MIELTGFDSLKSSPFRLQGEIKRQNGIIEVRYRVEGPVSALILPVEAAMPAFTDELWKTTCFELFMRVEGQEGYEEWNFSPSGNWAHYHFTSYRQRRPDVDAGKPESRKLHSSAGELILLTQIRDRFVGKNLRFALTAVLESRTGEKSYWAMNHSRPQPDFHAPESFVGKL